MWLLMVQFVGHGGLWSKVGLGDLGGLGMTKEVLEAPVIQCFDHRHSADSRATLSGFLAGICCT